VLIHQYFGIRLVPGIVVTALNLGSIRPPSATRARKAAGSRSRLGWNRCMIQTATRTTAGANKNKNATMTMHSENRIGCRILSLLAPEAKPPRIARRAVTPLRMNGVPSVCITQESPGEAVED